MDALQHRHCAGTDDDGAEVSVWTGVDGNGGPKVEGAGAGKGAGAEEARAGVAEEDGPSDPWARALRVPGNMIVGSSRS